MIYACSFRMTGNNKFVFPHLEVDEAPVGEQEGAAEEEACDEVAGVAYGCEQRHRSHLPVVTQGRGAQD